ncbi:MAG: hypothetical protein AB1630_11475 [bacterium]
MKKVYLLFLVCTLFLIGFRFGTVNLCRDAVRELKRKTTLESIQPLPPTAPVWINLVQNPLIGEQPAGPLRWPSDPFVLKEGDRFRMWFGAHNPEENVTRIGYAESEDGVHWILNNEPVVPLGTSTAFDSKDVETPTIVRDGNTYHLWYSGARHDRGYQIGHAVSDDGIEWTKEPEHPVLYASDNPYAWTGLGVLEPTVILESSTFKMWFVGLGLDPVDSTTIHVHLGYATSSDGQIWDLHEDNPLLKLASYKEGDLINSAFFVLRNGDYYQLFYLGGGTKVPDIYGTSRDGLSWSVSFTEVLPVGSADSWNSWVVGAPTILLDSVDGYTMWYSGGRLDSNFGMHFGIGGAKAAR